MKPGFFIDRPVFSTVLSVLIVLVGIIGLVSLPIEQYPQITPPVVKISASYPGANAATVSQAVATPLEQELNGTPGMIYMESSSSNSGGLSITVTFDVSTDVDLAAVEVQNRVKLAEARLPAEVLQNGISVEKQAPSQLLTIALTSDDPKFNEIYLSNYATINVLDVLRRIPGVGRVSNIGSRYYGMQIWVYPDRLASFGLTVKDLQNALKDQNRESAAGELGKPPVAGVDVAIPLTAPGRLSSVSDFEEIVVRANPDGSFIRMRDVARVSLEASSYSTESGLNGSNAAILGIYMLPGANAMQVATEVKEAMKEIAQDFPEGLDYLVPFDMTEYIAESIHEVYKTLFEALFLVILVVFLSLQSWRTALIPIVAVPISLVGTFGFMLIMGFSLNMLTLLGLVLAIGIVVDDAIVVVENVERIMEQRKIGAREATHIAMKELTGALIATSLVLAAVFIPVSFLAGITGSLFRQFSVTIVVSVLISAVVALTLSPAMCAIILRPQTGRKNIVFRKINIWLNRGNKKYTRLLDVVLNRPRRIMAGFGMVLVLIFVLSKFIPSGFIPQEDQGVFTVELAMPEGTTIERTREVTERAIAYLSGHDAVEYVQNVTGSSPRVGTNQGRATLTVILKPWKERDKKVEEVMRDVQREFHDYPEISAFTTRPPVVPGLGSAGGVEFQLQARSGAEWDDLVAAVDTFRRYAAETPELASVSTSLQPEIPQLYFDVDRDQAQLLGVPYEPRRYQPVFRQNFVRFDGAAFGTGQDCIHDRAGQYHALQYVYFGSDAGDTGPRPQFGTGDGGDRGDRRRALAGQYRSGLERPFVPGTKGFGTDRQGDGPRVAVRFPVPCRAIRKLDRAAGGAVVVACGGVGRLSGHRCAGTRSGCLLPDRSGDADGVGGQKRDPDRRIRQDTGRRRGRSRCCRDPCRTVALPPYPDDVARVRTRYAADGDRLGARFGEPPFDRYGRILRDDLCDYGGDRAGAVLLRDGL